jgi:hypothetical protein
LQVEFAPDQRRYNGYPRLARPQHVEGLLLSYPEITAGKKWH